MSKAIANAVKMEPISSLCGNTFGSSAFHFYVSNFFKIPKDIKNDIIYCQRALKAHIKVHQMVLDVFQQQPNADITHKMRILNELESEIYEINAEQHFLILRVRRIIDEFYKSLKEKNIPIDQNFTNNVVAKEIVPNINDNRADITPVNVIIRCTEEKLIKKYFEIQKEVGGESDVIDLDDENTEMESNPYEIEEKIEKTEKSQSKYRRSKRQYASSGESLLLSGRSATPSYYNVSGQPVTTQKSLLKPINQRIAADVQQLEGEKQPKITGAFSLNDLFNQKLQNNSKQEADVSSTNKVMLPMELPVPTSVKMSRMNLRQALKRAQAAVRGPTSAINSAANLSAPPPLTPIQFPRTTAASTQSQQMPKLANISQTTLLKRVPITKPKTTRNSVATAVVAAAVGPAKTPEPTSSSGESSPERELEETRTKADEYGQEMFLRIFDLFTPQVYAQMQQRRSKRRRRCVQKNERSMYHYGKIEHNIQAGSIELEQKKKRKAFLLSPQTKKSLPNKRVKGDSVEKTVEINSDGLSATTSRSNTTSPVDKHICNECLQNGGNLKQCIECKLWYHLLCHRSDDDKEGIRHINKEDYEAKTKSLCPKCKKSCEETIKNVLLKNENLQKSVKELELQLAKERDRREILQRTGKQYKIEMNNLYRMVNAIKTDQKTDQATLDCDVITLD